MSENKIAESGFRHLSPYDIQKNVFQMIDNEWFLLTAGPLDNFNTMTASWGGMGILWNKPVAICFVRPQRYTYLFMEKADRFTLCFFTEAYREVLNFCGSHSGRNVHKPSATGLHQAGTDSGAVFFTEASLVFDCKKIYFNDLNPDHFLDAAIMKNYPKRDFHRMYIGEITDCFVKLQP